MIIKFVIVFLSASVVFGNESECQKTSLDDGCLEDENSIETGNIDESLNNFDQVKIPFYIPIESKLGLNQNFELQSDF